VTALRRRGVRRVLVALVAVVAVTGPLAGTALAASGASVPTTAADGADVDAGPVTAGNVATVEVQLPDGTDTATLSIDDQGHDFAVNATLHDRDGDGVVTVALDTAAAGNGNASSFLSARGADTLSDAVQTTDSFEGGLDPFPYDVELVRSGAVVAEGTLFVESDPTAGNETATGSFDYAGDRLTLSAADNQTVRGETSLPAGTEVTVVLDSVGSDRSTTGLRWVESYASATVTEDGTFSATVDLAGHGSNVTFQARLVHDETAIATTRGRVTACERHCLRTDEVRVRGSVEVDQNRTAEIPVTFGGADRLNVTVTNTDGPDYRLNATVRDTDGDGRATLLVRTENAGADDPTLFVREGNETRPADVVGETTGDGPLPAALYQVAASVPGERNAWDTGTLVVFQSSLPPATPTATDAPESADGRSDDPASAGATETPETPDPLDVQTDGENDGAGLLPLGSIGVGGLVAIGGLLRLLRR
jgi:hypothetical protein